MMPRVPITIDSPLLLGASLVVVAVAAVVVIRRRAALARLSKALGLVGAIALCLAIAGAAWERPATTDPVVMVDLSPSTRGAEFRDRAKLDARIRQLVDPAIRYEVIYFAGTNTTVPPGDAAKLADLPADRTVFAPPAAPAVLLFSDGRFELPAYAPPVFAVTDPALDRPTDGAVVALRAERSRGGAGNLSLSATVRLIAPPEGRARPLTITPTIGESATNVAPAPDPLTLSRPIRAGSTLATAAFVPPRDRSAADLWPENDALSLPLLPPAHTERWFVSAGSAPPAGDWRRIAPEALPPAGSAEYLAASLIVLDNLPAAAIPADRQAALEQYVRDLGGALVIAGGDRAFAAGLYPGTPIEALSPLASVPPRPTTRWVLLADTSGSMSQAVEGSPGATRWQRASGALLDLLPTLPPEDLVTIGSFSGEVAWWTSPARRPAREVAAMRASLPPRGVGPMGPTNLGPALERVAREADAGTPTELLVLSDADVQIDDAAGLAARLKAKKVRLHLLAVTDPGVTQPQGLPALRTITAATGGTLLSETGGAAQWAAQVRQLLSAAFPNRLIATPTAAKFLADLSRLPGRPIAPWNRTWLKPTATALAETPAPEGGAAVPLAARHSIGGGDVLATGFTPNADELAAITAQIARPPRDPRFAVTWSPGARLTVRVDAGQAVPMNGLKVTLRLTPATEGSDRQPREFVIPQTAPGRYELTTDAPRQPTYAAVLVGGATIDQTPLPGRYAPEFDAIGNDYEALGRLAAQTGGRIVTAVDTKPLDLPTPRRPLPLGPYLAITAAVLVSAALVRWRWA